MPDIINYDKILNSRCYCKTGLPWKNDIVIMCYPCEHMFHKSCYNLLNNICKFCNTQIEKIFTLHDKNLHYQRFADILSMSNFDNMSIYTSYNFIDSLFDITSIIARIPYLQTKKTAKELCEHIFSLNNMTVNVHGYEKIKLEKNKIYIANHVSHLELILIYYLFGTGFLASSINQNITDKIKHIVPLLSFNRGEQRKINIVDEIKKFVNKNGSICIFPEGLMKHPDTLTRFRTGAFHAGHPIYSVTIKYNDIISDTKINNFIYKMCTKKIINLDVVIMGPFYPPFSNNDIEKIRYNMANAGRMVLSRVANRDIIDG